MRVVIIGGNSAGNTAARTLLRHDPGADIHVVDRNSKTPYAGCSMKRLIAGDIIDWRLLLVGRNEPEHGLNRLGGWEAMEIKRAEREVLIAGNEGTRSLPYDRLILASGAAPEQIPGAAISSRTFFFKSLENAVALNRFIEEHRPADMVVVGGGPAGVGIALALQRRGVRCRLIDEHDHPLAWLPPELGVMIRDRLIASGIQFLGGFHTTGIDDSRSSVGVSGSGGQAANAAGAICVMGWRPDTTLAVASGIRLGRLGGIAVDASLVTSDDRIFAAGDCAETRHGITRRPCRGWGAVNAVRQGRTLGLKLAGKRATAPLMFNTIITGDGMLQAATTGLNPLDQDTSNQRYLRATTLFPSPPPAMKYTPPTLPKLGISLLFDPAGGRLLGVQAAGEGAADTVRLAAPALYHGATLEDVLSYDPGYTPELGPVWHPLLMACRRALG
ncbi:FAD-dependent oxidoreductase [bacterium]|nr:FAD-dependent oxidoreductase [candidate division CSSED10-310 bacterium]